MARYLSLNDLKAPRAIIKRRNDPRAKIEDLHHLDDNADATTARREPAKQRRISSSVDIVSIAECVCKSAGSTGAGACARC